MVMYTNAAFCFPVTPSITFRVACFGGRFIIMTASCLSVLRCHEDRMLLASEPEKEDKKRHVERHTKMCVFSKNKEQH